MIDRSYARRRSHLASALLFAAAFATASCDKDPLRATMPTTFNTVSTPSAVFVSAMSSTVFAQPRSSFSCPAISPFFAPMVILVQQNGVPGFVVSQIQLQFTDSSGRAMPQVTLPAPVPTTQFGTALRDSLTFPITLGLGCGFGSTGTVLVLVSTHDGLGHLGSGRMNVMVQ
jgi:hypothetical protein